MTEVNKIYCENCLDTMSRMQDGSVDCLVTDPPYGYSFMGKDWDKVVPSVEIWKECLRVMKPGAFAFIMSAPRQDVLSHMLVNLDKAGFDTGFTSIYHTYASGFPKALNLHKKLTKSEAEGKQDMQELWRTIIHSSQSVEQSNDRAYLSELLADLEQGKQHEIFSHERGKIESIQISERQQQSFMERRVDLSPKERQLCECSICEMPCGIYINGSKGWLCYGTSVDNGKIYWEVIDEDGMCTSFESQPIGQSDREFEIICEQCRTQKVGTLESAYAGFQPKPAVEIIIVAMKPLSEKSYTDQALKNKKGITWLDDCRIGTEGARFNGRNVDSEIYGKYGTEKQKEVYDYGRFPANLLVSDDVLNDGKIYSSGFADVGDGGNGDSQFMPNSKVYSCYNDSGSFSRFYDLDKWWEERIKTLPESVRKVFPFLIEPKAAKSEKNFGCETMDEEMVNDGRKVPPDNAFQRGKTLRTNKHPTVKPLKLMSYLIVLGSREGDTILEPFAGSGTTCIAAHLQNRNYIASEINKEYYEIAVSRIKQFSAQQKLQFA